MLSDRILVVDDEPSNAKLLVRVLERAGYRNVRMSLDSANVLALVKEYQPQLLVLDLRSACESPHSEAVSLRREIGACRQIITQAELDLLGQMTGTSEEGDPTDGHCARVGELAAALAEQLHLDEGTVESIRAAAPLHDVGKVAVSQRILLKPGPLTPDEMEVVCRHTVIGGFLLSGTELPLLRLASEIALYHHERWDGTGYPRGLCAEEIPLSARIVAVADVFDALTSDRSYKRAWSVRDALTEIISKSGAQFDPRVVGALVATVLRRDIVVAAAEAGDTTSVLSLVDRQRQREAQLQAAITTGHQLQRAWLVRNVLRRPIVA